VPQVDELTLVVNSNVGGAVAGLKTVGAQANKTGEKVGRAFTKMGAKATAAGKVMTMGLTLPIVAIGAAVIKLGMDAESALATLQANAGMSADQLSDVQDGLFNIIGPMATDMPTAVDAAFTLFSAGITDTNDLLADTEAVLMAVNANLGDSKDIAGLAAVAYANFGQDATRTLDVLTYAASQAILGPDEMIKIFNRAAPTAAAAGVAFDDMAVAAIILANATGDSAKAGMFLDGMLKKIASAGPMATAALSEIGMDVPDFQKVFADMGLDAGLDFLDAEFAKAGLRSDEWTRQLFEGEAAIAAMALLGNDMGVSLADGVENADGELQGAFDVMMGTTGKKVEVIISTIKAKMAELGILILEAIGPYIDQFTEKLDELVEAWDNLSDEAKLNIVKIAGVLATLGPALLIFGKLSTIFGAFIPILIKIGTAFLTMNPIVLAIAAVVAILAGAFFAMGGDLEDLKAIGIAVWEKLQEVAAIAVEMLKTLMAGLSAFWDEHGEAIIATFQRLGDFITDAIETLVAFLTPIFEEFAAAMEAVFGDLVAWFEENWPAIQETVEIVMGHVQDIIDRVLPHVQKIFEAVVGFIGTYVKAIFELMAEQIRSVMNIIKGIIEIVMGIIRGDWKMVWEGIKKVMDGIWDGIFAIVDTALTLIKKAIGLAWTAITEGLQLLFTIIDKIWDAGWNAMKDVVSDIWSGIGDIIKGAFKGALNWVIEKINWAIDKLNGLIRGLNKTPFVNIPEVANIPGLSDGGTLSSGGMVKVGEAGPEMVSLPKGASVTPLRGGETGGGASIHIENMYSGADPHLLATELGWELTKRGR